MLVIKYATIVIAVTTTGMTICIVDEIHYA